MKSYLAQDQLRIVGKGWEVRQYLRKLTKEKDRDVTLASLLSGLTHHAERAGYAGRVGRIRVR
jgi:hypothetical protein